VPELPEVETVRRGLEPAMTGRRILRAEVRRDGLRWPFPARMKERLEGARIESLRRRSKYILGDLSTGETLIVHLGMSGRVLVSGAPAGGFVHARAVAQKHDHVILHMEPAPGDPQPGHGGRVAFNDARRFGTMDLWPTAQLENHRLLARLGPEPLGNRFDENWLAGRLAGRRTPIKAALLDQRIVAGLGNIYVCEALHRAGISPRRAAGRISRRRISHLVGAIRAVLREAIDAGGSSLRDHRRTNGELGYFQHQFRVYGREGEACKTPGCKGRIRRLVQSGRSSFHCAQCQR